MYIEEWEFIIKYKTSNGAFIKAYFCLFREAVGIKDQNVQWRNSLKYRPYDVNLRPKIGQTLNGIIHWPTKKVYLEGIERSLKHRWKENIKPNLCPDYLQMKRRSLKSYLTKT